MAYAGNVKRNSTFGSALILLLLVATIVAVIIWLALNPDILDDLLHIAIIAAVIVIAAIAIVYLVMIVLAIPYYAAKGEKYQTNASYDLDDVKSVKETDSEKRDE